MATILHPTDFSETSRSAFENALGLAFVGRHKLVLLHVSAKKMDRNDWSEFPHIRSTLASWGFITEDMKASELRDKTGLHVVKIAATGRDPVGAVVEYLKRNTADLIVVSTAGRDGMEGWLNKSISMQMADELVQPVLFVRKSVDGLVGKNKEHSHVRVLVPVDNDPDPQLAVDAALSLKRFWKMPVGRVMMLHVGTSPLRQQVALPQDEEVEFSNQLVDGEVEEEILKACHEHEMDLIVMTRAGPDRLAERFMGSTTEQIVRSSPCAVLLVRTHR